MWYLLQVIIIVGLCILYKSEIAPEHSMGHIFLFSTLVAYAVTWLISRAIDLVRTNGRTCFLISLLITAAVIVWWITSLARPLDAPGFAIMGVIGFCIFVPSMWAVSKGILLVRRLQGHAPPPRPARPPVTLAALAARWHAALSLCIWWLLTVLFFSLTIRVFGVLGDEIGQWPLGVCLIFDLIAPFIVTRAIMQRLLRGSSGSGEITTTPFQMPR